MNLYIETENGQIKNHPAFEDNLIAAFGSVPAHWVPFERVERPSLGVYEVWTAEEPTYEIVDGVYKDVWHKRDMTAEEKTTKQQATQAQWASRPNLENYTAWTFNEATCAYVPPTPMPETGNYFWQGTTSSWVAIPQRPNDGKQYKLDFASASWVEVTQP